MHFLFPIRYNIVSKLFAFTIVGTNVIIKEASELLVGFVVIAV